MPTDTERASGPALGAARDAASPSWDEAKVERLARLLDAFAAARVAEALRWAADLLRCADLEWAPPL